MGERRREQRIPLREAAQSLGISKEALRQRIRRGSIRSEKDADGRVYVYVDASLYDVQDASRTTRADTESELVEALRDEVRYLREQLDAERQARTDERRRHDTIMAQLIQRVPELEPPSQETPETPETVTEAPGRAGPQPAGGGPQEPSERRSWWRRMFGA